MGIMRKSIQWRINHAERKIAEGKQVNKFKSMLDNYKRMRTEEKAKGIRFEHRQGNKEFGVPQAWIKV